MIQRIWAVFRGFVPRFLAVVGALYLIATLTPIDRWWTNLLTGQFAGPQGDTLIVLGAESFPDIMGRHTYMRAVYAVRMWRSGGYKRILLCGGPPPQGKPVAELMREFLVGEGVPESAITVEISSSSTRENALRAIEALRGDTGRKVVLTSDFHSFRAFRVFRKAGFDGAAVSCPDYYKLMNSWQERWPVFLGLIVETSKIAYYFVRGWI